MPHRMDGQNQRQRWRRHQSTAIQSEFLIVIVITRPQQTNQWRWRSRWRHRPVPVKRQHNRRSPPQEEQEEKDEEEEEEEEEEGEEANHYANVEAVYAGHEEVMLPFYAVIYECRTLHWKATATLRSISHRSCLLSAFVYSTASFVTGSILRPIRW